MKRNASWRQVSEALERLARAGTDAARKGGSGIDWREAATGFGIRLRLVRLRNRSWWLLDNGSLLAFRAEDGAPVVLRPSGSGRYRLLDPGTGNESALDERAARGLRQEAFMAYPAEPVSDGFASAASTPGDGDALLQLGYGTAAALVASAVVVALLALAASGTERDAARFGVLALAGTGLAASFALLEQTGTLAGLRWRVRANLLLHASVWNRVLGLPLARFRSMQPVELASRIEGTIAGGDRLAAQRGVVRFAAPALVAAAAVLLLVSPGAAGFAGAALAVLGIAQFGVARAHQASLRREWGLEPAVRQARLVLSSCLPVLRAMGALGWVLGSARAAAERELAAATRSELLNRSEAVLRRLGPAVVAVAAVAGAGTAPWVDRAALALLAWVAGTALCALASAWARMRGARSLVSEAGQALRPEAAGPGGGRRSGPVVQVSVEEASFAYEGSAQPSLVDVSLELRPGECLAIAGPSGSGKTTLVRLLAGLEHPTRGAVRVNGVDLRSADVDDYRRRVGAVFQDEPISVATVRGTILGMAPIGEEQAWAAARTARVADAIAGLPLGMQTIVAMATVPSAMLNQLLIARTLARHPEIVIFDETFSNLDEEVQSGLVSDLRQAGTAVVICSHRPSTIALADRVVRLDRGRVVSADTQGPRT